jgi:hypothetical protein
MRADPGAPAILCCSVCLLALCGRDLSATASRAAFLCAIARRGLSRDLARACTSWGRSCGPCGMLFNGSPACGVTCERVRARELTACLRLMMLPASVVDAHILIDAILESQGLLCSALETLHKEHFCEFVP